LFADRGASTADCPLGCAWVKSEKADLTQFWPLRRLVLIGGALLSSQGKPEWLTMFLHIRMLPCFSIWAPHGLYACFDQERIHASRAGCKVREQVSTRRLTLGIWQHITTPCTPHASQGVHAMREQNGKCC
jgi:hypothetical protein